MTAEEIRKETDAILDRINGAMLGADEIFKVTPEQAALALGAALCGLLAIIADKTSEIAAQLAEMNERQSK